MFGFLFSTLLFDEFVISLEVGLVTDSGVLAISLCGCVLIRDVVLEFDVVVDVVGSVLAAEVEVVVVVVDVVVVVVVVVVVFIFAVVSGSVFFPAEDELTAIVTPGSVVGSTVVRNSESGIAFCRLSSKLKF